ncbi:molecular chaperone HtpG [Christensenellaceae bacterium NSJ-44]|uniref:Chaperone protein HtpG n=1 Tax=Luoshenia tenuis TaxID=2763654 RepID=A0A926D012_9FIRM|nr:molecular chaperone HtpG [Luoshenia tenuis]MBC8529087.1 molecular chaperone HtpG [Luoshenia tenuis]
MAKKQFKTESKRILDLMINSIYTHREIFLRELISNASDASDKLYFTAMKEGNTGLNREDLPIHIGVDKENRVLTISDHGCGMKREELENNLGVIARSGTLNFKKDNDLGEDIDVIGQFGVGFYAAFMVSKKVTVQSRAYGSDEAWQWQSTGADGYTIEPCEKAENGTDIILEIKDDEGEEHYGEFLEQYRLAAIVKKYSDYVRYPIQMEMESTRMKEGSETETETVVETSTLNSMVPIWRRAKGEVTDEDYNNFYKEKFMDFEDPLSVVSHAVEGAVTYQALLFIPKAVPFNYYSRDFEKGLQLYSNGVMIMDKCPDLLPDAFSFVRGLVDSSDLSLNISRETLQHDRQLRAIANNVKKKIKSELQKLLKNDREKYELFFKNFGRQLKVGVYTNYGAEKEFLQDLLLFHSLAGDKLIALQEYVDAMPEGQKYIYYACGTDINRVAQLPQMERVRDAGYDVLCMTEDIDEFAVRMMRDFAGKEFKSISDNDLGLDSQEDQEKAEQQAAEYKALFEDMQKALEGKVKQVKLSSRLKSHPVCLSSDGPLSLEMEKVLNAMPTEEKVKADRILELNGDHPVFETLCKLQGKDEEKLGQYAQMLYDQALLIAGMEIEDPVAYCNRVCQLMADKA